MLLATVLFAGILLSACTAPTQGPTIQIDADGWTADPETMVQADDQVELMNGVPDVSGQVVYEVYDVNDQGFELSRPVLAYGMIHPGEVGELLPPGWEPASIEAGEDQKVAIGGGFGMGGGDSGSYAVISYEPGGLERGDYAVFNLTDANGEIPQMDLEEFCDPFPCRDL